MSIEWGDYEPYVPSVTGPLDELPRKEARAEFTKLMDEKDQRIAALTALLERNSISLDSSDEALQQLNDWFVKEVQPDPDDSNRLLSRWYGVVNDLSLFLGDVIIQRCPNLRWVMFDKGAKDLSYQRHVIMGFTKVKNPKYNVDVDGIVAMIGHRAIGGLELDPQHFVKLVQECESDA